MYKFINRLIEIKNVLDHLWFIERVLDFIIILLAGFLLIVYTGLPPILIIVPIALYFLIVFRYKFIANTVELVEKKYPELDERLRTLYDNKNETNVIIDDLAGSVLLDIEKIKYSSFFETRKLGIRIAVILLLVTMLISNSVNYLSFVKEKTTQEKISPVIQEGMTRNGEDIFDEPSFTNISNNADGLIMSRGTGSELNIQGTEKKSPEIHHAFPGNENIDPVSSKAYSEAVPAIYQRIVKNYFMNISRE